MNIKKIGLTALAASLVSVSAHAGAVSVADSTPPPCGLYDKSILRPSIISGNVYKKELFPGAESDWAIAVTIVPLLPSNVSHTLPAADASIAVVAEFPPSPENTKVPSSSDETVTEWLSNGADPPDGAVAVFVVVCVITLV